MEPADLEAAWPLTGTTVGDELPSGPRRRVVVVNADQGRFVAKLDSRPRPDVADADQLSVLDYLAERRFAHAPMLLRTREGERTARVAGALVSLSEYVPAPVSDGEPHRAWQALGHVASRLNAFGDFPVAFAVSIGEAMEELRRRAAGRSFEIRFLELLARVAELASLGGGALVHGEINLANAGRRADGTIVLFDWDQSGAGARVLECGYPLITNFIDEDRLTFDKRSASAFYDSYAESGGVVEPGELFTAALFHALRYMWWGDVGRRWRRILHAVDRESELCSVLP